MAAHQAVLYRETLDNLDIKANGIYIDCTFGRGGHSQGILKQLNEQGRLLALDRDLQAINSPEASALQANSRFMLEHCAFSELATIANKLGISGQVSGILMDLGVSSPQLDSAERGFSFLREGPLDMRMDASKGLSAAEYIAKVDEKELVRILFEYGEERFARQIARAIVQQQQKQPLVTTLQLAKLIETSVPFRDKHKHPATRTFQALRIEVNQELEQVKSALKQAIPLLASGGRLVVISFHSLEDRIVKRFIREQSGRQFNPGRLPVKEQDIARGQLIKIGKSIRASQEELEDNPRARSAIMRVAEKI